MTASAESAGNPGDPERTLFEVLGDLSPVGVFECDAEAQCTRVNRRWCGLSGLSESESLGRGWFRAIHPDDRRAVVARLKEAADSDQPFAQEYRLQRPDGSVRWVLAQAMARKGPDGGALGFVGSITDISDRRHAEEALQASEERYRRLVEFSPDLIAEVKDGKFTFINRAGLAMLHANSKAEIVGREVAELLAEQGLSGEQGVLDAVLGGADAPPVREVEYRTPDGSVVNLEWGAIRTTSEGGPAMQVVARDITDRKRAEANERAADAAYRTVVEGTSDAVSVVDCDDHGDWRYSLVNEAFVRRSGLTRAQLIGRTATDLVAIGVYNAQHAEESVARLRTVIAGGRPLEEEQTLLWSGREITLLSMFTPVFDRDGRCRRVMTATRDVTRRREQERALRDSEQNYRAVVEGTAESLWVMDRDETGDWRIALVNDAYVRRSGLSREQLVGRAPRELVAIGVYDAEYAAKSAERHNEAASAGHPIEFETQTKWSGRDVVFMTSLTPIVGADGSCNRVIGTTRDVTRRRQQDEALRHSEENYRAVVEGTSDAVWVMDRDEAGDFRVTLVNSRVFGLLGISPEQMVGFRLVDFLGEPAAATALNRYAEAERLRETIEYETSIDRNGLRADVVTQITPLFDELGECTRIIGSARDITARRQAEAALLQAQKLESLGVLAGGIAHDFNNLLTTILGNLFLARNDLGPGSQAGAYLDDARQAAERGGDLIRRLLAYGRPGLDSREAISLRRLLQETVAFSSRSLGPSIEVELRPADGDDSVWGEFSALQQVFLNLLVNARDAMPEGGRITVETRSLRTLGEAAWASAELKPGSYQLVLVSDTGEGIAAELLSRIFDPFFTTKEVGKGTGLGLSTAFSIVRAHGGWLDVRSRPGEGSTFRVLLPAAGSG